MKTIVYLALILSPLASLAASNNEPSRQTLSCETLQDGTLSCQKVVKAEIRKTASVQQVDSGDNFYHGIFVGVGGIFILVFVIWVLAALSEPTRGSCR